MSADIGGAPEGPSRGVTIALVIGLALIICAIIVYVSLPDTPEIPLVPENVPRVSQEGVTFYFNEFKLQDRMISVTLDFQDGVYQGGLWELEKDLDSVLWLEYGGAEYAAITKMAIPIKLPPGVKVVRVILIGHLKKDDPAPQEGERIKGGMQIPGHLLKRSTHQRLVVDGVERVAK